jgi:hypothetical protein
MSDLTTKQRGDAGEYLVMAELNFAGVPALKVPDNWPGCDVIARPLDSRPLDVSVKTRTFKPADYVAYRQADRFDFLALVLLPGNGLARRRIFLIPRLIADAKMKKDGPRAKTQEMYCAMREVERLFGPFENNFRLESAA